MEKPKVNVFYATCPHCGKKNALDSHGREVLFRKGEIICGFCRKIMSLGGPKKKEKTL